MEAAFRGVLGAGADVADGAAAATGRALIIGHLFEEITHVCAPTRVEQSYRRRHKGRSNLTLCMMLRIYKKCKHLAALCPMA
jgi:hypothetical protein